MERPAAGQPVGYCAVKLESRRYRRNAVEALLREAGPLTAEQIDTRLEWKAGRAAETLGNTRFQYPGKVFPIVEFIPVPPGQRCRPRAVYGLGEKEDVPRLGRKSRRRTL